MQCLPIICVPTMTKIFFSNLNSDFLLTPHVPECHFIRTVHREILSQLLVPLLLSQLLYCTITSLPLCPAVLLKVPRHVVLKEAQQLEIRRNSRKASHNSKKVEAHRQCRKCRGLVNMDISAFSRPSVCLLVTQHLRCV